MDSGEQGFGRFVKRPDTPGRDGEVQTVTIQRRSV
jgi:hypothetical protein